jgi:hypothetical protein
MPQNTIACWDWIGLLMKLLEGTIYLGNRPFPPSTDLLYAPTLNMQAQKASDSPRR